MDATEARMDKAKQQHNGNKFISVSTHITHVPIKRHRVSEWIRKQDPSICCLQETHFRPKDILRLKVRGWRTIYHANGHQKKAGVAILISDKLDFKIKTVTRDEEGHYIIIMGSIHQEDKDFNTPLTAMDRSSKQKTNKETVALNDTLDQMDLTDIFRTFHPKVAGCTFFLRTHGKFSRIDT
ncbi:Hypothetical predicted protein [Lynx pardinus]|uniref:exodeoxyribonuclease III n=1 Tax=Lynx pardinus TaxID=191816 RepID=A0A485MDF1_LYNPA|nr:Hypothetical predicted protein [Lynx pardinus]